MSDLLIQQTYLQLTVAVVAATTASLGAVAYLRRVRLERPAIGAFNFRDIGTLIVFIVALPVLYLQLPQDVLTVFLLVTFASALSIGLRPLVRPEVMWLGIGALLGLNLWVARTMLGTETGWQLYWVLVSVVVAGSAISIANLYVQGGMRLRHAAWFCLALSVYDFTFSTVLPLTPKLADKFQGHPLNAAVGMRWDVFNAAIGVGDLLAFGIFAAAAYKAYGGNALRPTLALVVLFGAVAPSLTPLAIGSFTRGSLNVVVPVQTWFGPPAFLLYRWLRRRYGPERTMREFLAADEVAAAPIPVPVQA